VVLELSDKTALVTGASAGIGRELARVLGRELRSIVLVARRRDRLEELSKELANARPELRVLVRDVDLTDRRATGAMLDGLERDGELIDVLVNNAGFGIRGLFDQSDWDRTEQMLELNVVSATFLVRRLVPPMVARGRGAVMNVGSTAGVIMSPGSITYSASKAYLNHLSEMLRIELAGTGVTVTALLPGPVETEFQEVAGEDVRPPLPRVLFVTAADVAEEAVLGMKRGRARVIPGAPLRAIALAFESMPKAAVRPFFARMASRIRRPGR
jgi:short-subunit dehydrogenase